MLCLAGLFERLDRRCANFYWTMSEPASEFLRDVSIRDREKVRLDFVSVDVVGMRLGGGRGLRTSFTKAISFCDEMSKDAFDSQRCYSATGSRAK